jgi:hypothetical protein
MTQTLYTASVSWLFQDVFLNYDPGKVSLLSR